MMEYPTPPIPNLTLPKFKEGVNHMKAFLETFEMTERTAGWQEELWPAYLRSSLSGAGMVAVSSLSAIDHMDYQVLKDNLLATYKISNETYHRRIFEQTFDQHNFGVWL